MDYRKSKNIADHILSVMLRKEHKDDTEFLKWITENKHATESIHEFSDEELFAERVNRFRKVDLEKSSKMLFNRISAVEKRKKRRVILRIIGSAAAVVLLSAVCYQQLVGVDALMNQPMQETIEKSSRIKPVANDKAAILVLHNGDKINLSTETDDKMKDHLAQVQKNDTTPMRNKIITPDELTYKVILSDGTHVWINENSEISFPAEFRGDTREIELVGEAYFEVAHNPNIPFIVKSQNNSKIKVLGTKFNISTKEDKTYTTLVEGSVEVQSNDKKIVIKPSEQAVVTAGNSVIEVSDVDTNLFVAWKDGKYAFKDEKISTIMEKISKWYNVTVEYDNNKITPNLELSGSLRKYDTFTEVIEVMEATGLIEIKVKEIDIIRIYQKK